MRKPLLEQTLGKTSSKTLLNELNENGRTFSLVSLTDFKDILKINKTTWNEDIYDKCGLFQIFTGFMTDEPPIGLICYKNKSPVGYILGTPASSNTNTEDYEITGEDVLYGYSICVLPECQGKGVGSDLLSIFNAIAYEKGYRTVVGHTRSVDVVNFASGVILKKIEDYYNKNEDAYYFQYDLTKNVGDSLKHLKKSISAV